MGLIYSSSDSSAMMRALSSNLAVARTTTSELTAGCQQLNRSHRRSYIVWRCL